MPGEVSNAHRRRATGGEESWGQTAGTAKQRRARHFLSPQASPLAGVYEATALLLLPVEGRIGPPTLFAVEEDCRPKGDPGCTLLK